MRRTTTAFVFALSITGCSGVSGPADRITLRVSSSPPAERPGAPVRPAEPREGFVWVAGAWDYFDGIHFWREGHWVPQKPGYDYVRASYEYDGQTWWFHVPHWKRHHDVALTAARVP